LLFLYKKVLKKDFGWLDDIERAKKPSTLLVVFTREEVKAILMRLEGSNYQLYFLK